MKNFIRKKNVFGIACFFVIVSIFSPFTFAEHCLLPQGFITLPKVEGKEGWWFGKGYYRVKNHPVAASWGLANSESNKWNIHAPNRNVGSYSTWIYLDSDWNYTDEMNFPTSIETDPKDSQLHVTVSSKSGLKACSYHTNAGEVIVTLKDNPQIDINDPGFLQQFHITSSHADESVYECDAASISAEGCSWKYK